MAASMSAMVLDNYPEFEYRDEFIHILDLLSNQVKVDEYLSILSQKVGEGLLATRGIGSDKRGVLPESQDELAGIVLHDILCKKEVQHEFSADVWYLGGVLSEFDFLNMTKDGHPFMDPLVNKNHGAQTHRIQWWMVCNEIESKNLITAAANTSVLYRATEHESAKAKKGTIGPTLWYRVFDNIQGGGDIGSETARCPEWLMSHIKEKYTTYLKPAELAAQQWGTAPKATLSKYQELKILGFLARKGNVTKKGFG